MPLTASRFQYKPPQAASTTSCGPDHKWFDLPISDPDQVWFGHLACSCDSTGGCDEHKEPNLFYNPLLPPNAPMKLRQHGGQWHVSENAGKSKSLHAYSSPLDFFQSVTSKLHKLLSPRFTFKRKSQAAPNDSSQEAKKPHVPCSKEQPTASENLFKQSPPRYSQIAKFTSRLPYYPGHISEDISWSAQDNCLTWGSDLPFDAASFDTLAPMHPSMRYRLSFYHLHSVNRLVCFEDRGAEAHIIPSFSCHGNCGPSRISAGYNWSSELYLSRLFLQKQEIDYVLDLHSTGPMGIEITMCPHITVSLSKVTLRANEDGWLRASAQLSHKQRLSSQQRKVVHDEDYYRFQSPSKRHATYPDNIRWKSETGRLADLHSCRICHCDLERCLEVRGQRLHVRFTVYRDLGSGRDRFDPKWRSLLTGQGIPKPRSGLSAKSVYWQVIWAARSLKRPNLHTVAHTNAHG